ETNARNRLVQTHRLAAIDEKAAAIAVRFRIHPGAQRVEIEFPDGPRTGAIFPGNPAQRAALQRIAVRCPDSGVEPWVEPGLLERVDLLGIVVTQYDNLHIHVTD